MAYRITTRCTRCGACLEVCPVEAVAPAKPAFRIITFLCTECVGYAEEPICATACEPHAIVIEAGEAN